MNEKLENHYNQKDDWHKANISLAAEHFGYQCQICRREARKSTGVIHHLQYTGHDYKKPFEKLLQQNAITWICKECHKLEHAAYERSEVNFKSRNSGFCAGCDCFSWYGWYKIGFGRAITKPSPFPLCDHCLEVLIETRVLIRDQADIGFGRMANCIRFGEPENAGEIGKLLMRGIVKKARIGLFGDPKQKQNWQNPSSQQLGLF
jgi:hypothetical protein